MHFQVSLFSENSSRWLIADQAIMLCGAADAVRGASSPPHELAYIVGQSDSSGEHNLTTQTSAVCIMTDPKQPTVQNTTLVLASTWS